MNLQPASKTSQYSRRPSTRHPQQIRLFALSWIATILLAFAILVGGSTYAMHRQHDKARRMGEAGRSLSNNHLLELAILSAIRRHELWRLSGNVEFRQQELVLLNEASNILAAMQEQADIPQEKKLLADTAIHFESFYESSIRVQPNSEILSQSSGLLESVRRVRALNRQQMDATLRSSERLDSWTSLFSSALVLAAAIILIAGSLILWARIFRPVFFLARAANEFGAGNLEARAPVRRDDEMGALARRFNLMADAICDREKERLNFVATVAHDLRNPLVVIGGAAQLLKAKSDKLTAEERAEWLESIRKNTRKLEAAILDLTDSVQAETGQLVLQQEKLDLALLTTELVREQDAHHSHLLRCHAPDVCPIVGDRRRLERMVLNLVSNAVKYSPAGSEVTVEVKVQNSHAVLTVSDEGAGIAQPDLEKLFTPFTRLDHTRNLATGTGLGLSSVKKIVDAHDGTIQVSSQLNVGTTVEVKLPLTA